MPVPLPTSVEPSVKSRRIALLRPAEWALLVAGLLILWIGNNTDLDLALADAMFDRSRNVFPWQHAWLAERFNHEILKTALQVLGFAVVGVASWDCFKPIRRWSAEGRTGMRVLALSALLVPTAIRLLKRAASPKTTFCPAAAAWLTRSGSRSSAM